MEQIREEQKEIKRVLQRLLHKTATSDSFLPTQLPDEIKFPVSSLEEMEALDEQLGNQATMSAVVSRKNVCEILKSVLHHGCQIGSTQNGST